MMQLSRRYLLLALSEPAAGNDDNAVYQGAP